MFHTPAELALSLSRCGRSAEGRKLLESSVALETLEGQHTARLVQPGTSPKPSDQADEEGRRLVQADVGLLERLEVEVRLLKRRLAQDDPSTSQQGRSTADPDTATAEQEQDDESLMAAARTVGRMYAACMLQVCACVLHVCRLYGVLVLHNSA